MLIVQKFDEKLTRLVRKLPKSWHFLMTTLSFLGDPVIVLSAGFSVYVLSIAYELDSVRRALLYSVTAFWICVMLKFLLHRRRPYGLVIKTLGIESYSFPSGHAFGAVIFYGQFANLIFHHLQQPQSWIIAVTIWAGIFLIGVSRVYLKAHYPSDVVAGWLLGGLCLAIVNSIAY